MRQHIHITKCLSVAHEQMYGFGYLLCQWQSRQSQISSICFPLIFCAVEIHSVSVPQITSSGPTQVFCGFYFFVCCSFAGFACFLILLSVPLMKTTSTVQQPQIVNHELPIVSQGELEIYAFLSQWSIQTCAGLVQATKAVVKLSYQA